MKERLIETDVLVAGGSASGVCAAIQAARIGVNVMLVEVTPWLGGMLTAAGVSAIDGNHRLPSGLWGEFREHIYDFYGGEKAVETGWISNTQFEPRIGSEIIQWMVEKEENITVFYGFHITDAIVKDGRVCGAQFSDDKGNDITIHADISIDATEYGDLMAFSGCSYDLGRESRFDYGEECAPEFTDGIVQDLTYVAILKDYGLPQNKTLPKPPHYDPDNYSCTCKELCNEPNFNVADCKTMLDYGKLPHNKYMINWPINGNDYYLNIIELTHDERLRLLQDAKNYTLGWIYHLQTKGRMNHLGLAEDEFPTPDKLPFIPHIRESRRVRGVERLTLNDILKPYEPSQFGKYQTGIAVGDYPLDHRHFKAPISVAEDLPNIPAFNVPYGCLVPEKINGLLIAEKNISVTHVVNGCTRQQPVVMQIGQAAGAAAALAVKKNIEPREINIRELQQILLDANMWLMPFLDISPEDRLFQSVQRVALCGYMQGEPLPREWANEMWFHSDKNLKRRDAVDALHVALNIPTSKTENTLEHDELGITKAKAVKLIWTALDKPNSESLRQYFKDIPREHTAYEAIQYFNKQGWLKHLRTVFNFNPDEKIKRSEFAFLLDCAFKPFNSTLKCASIRTNLSEMKASR